MNTTLTGKGLTNQVLVQVLIDGRVLGVLERNVPRNLTLKPPSRLQDKHLTLDIIVHALGRVNFGCVWDFKGLIYPDIKLNGKLFYSEFPHAKLSSRPN